LGIFDVTDKPIPTTVSPTSPMLFLGQHYTTASVSPMPGKHNNNGNNSLSLNNDNRTFSILGLNI
jgi:hypothetical protein